MAGAASTRTPPSPPTQTAERGSPAPALSRSAGKPRRAVGPQQGLPGGQGRGGRAAARSRKPSLRGPAAPAEGASSPRRGRWRVGAVPPCSLLCRNRRATARAGTEALRQGTFLLFPPLGREVLSPYAVSQLLSPGFSSKDEQARVSRGAGPEPEGRHPVNSSLHGLETSARNLFREWCWSRATSEFSA